MTTDTDLLTTADLAERWDTTPDQISRRWREGNIPKPFNHFLARNWRWHRTVIEEFERTNGGAPT